MTKITFLTLEKILRLFKRVWFETGFNYRCREAISIRILCTILNRELIERELKQIKHTNKNKKMF